VSRVSDAAPRYVPAAGRRAFTALYDPVMAATMREGTWRPVLVKRVLEGLRPSAVVADVGAGTGTLAALLSEARPDADVVAIDGDPEVLERAALKGVRGREGLADALPLADRSADRVVMSLLLHHLDPDAKHAALVEARRVLRPGGRLHVADWGRPADPLMRLTFLSLQLLDGFAGTRDHVAGRLPGLIAGSGFGSVAVDERYRTPWGTLELITAN
jgi:ubiquinone/menaquinone biosynthesis C-methylase UbiE